MSGNPCKKMRLDFSNINDGSAGNEDLWGQDDLTAEEFDMLEIQATQSCNQTINHQNHHNCSISDQQIKFSEVDDSRQYQYELEGRVKLLSQSLEKSVKELSEERLKREQIINDRIKEFSTREINLQKEIEKMRSILEFKDQEMKSTYSKVQLLKCQLQDKKNNTGESLLNKNFEDFLKRSKSGPQEESCSLKSSKNFRRYKLSVDTPKGETKGIDVLSSILSTRLAISSLSSSEHSMTSVSLKNSSSTSDFTSVSVVQLKKEENNYELLNYYISFLKEHVTQLKTQVSMCNNTNSTKNSPVAIKRKEINSFAMTFLCDIAYLLSSSKFSTLSKKNENKGENVPTGNKKDAQNEANSNHLNNQDGRNSSDLREIVELLLSLADPKTFPIGYPKKEEIEFSLSALLNISLSYPDKFMELGFELPINSFLNPHESVTALCTTLKLLTAVSSDKSFALHLPHKTNNCILCLIATFLIGIVPYYPEKFSSSVILIEDFLSCVFSVHDVVRICLDAPCISEVVEGIIKSVWKYYQLEEKNEFRSQIIQKGFILLHTLSSCIPNFKELRRAVENEYILLITSLLDVSKENTTFKEFCDIIHSLWDFQTDTTEFELDDLPEEVQSLENEIVQ